MHTVVEPSGASGHGGAGGTGVEARGGAGGTGGEARGGVGGDARGGSGPANQKPLGVPCTAAPECQSGFCFDGVCCNTACTGACRSCALAGSYGICVPVATGLPDPHAACVAESPATCGRTGTCDGVGGCLRYPAGTACAAATCAGDTWTPAATCDGQGSCLAPATVSCAPLGCNTAQGRCNAGCLAGDTICPAGAYCAGDESCFPRKDVGLACAGDHECKSGHCADDVCRD
jgi:hypothetical protein